MSFSGEYEGTLDKQNRVKLPAQFKAALGNTFVITGLKTWGFVTLRTPLAFDQMMARLEANASPLDPVFMHVLPQLGASSFEVTTDDRGRFTVPPKLQSYVSPSVIFVGAGETVRVHKAAAWRTDSKQAEMALKLLAERLAGGG